MRRIFCESRPSLDYLQRVDDFGPVPARIPAAMKVTRYSDFRRTSPALTSPPEIRSMRLSNTLITSAPTANR